MDGYFSEGSEDEFIVDDVQFSDVDYSMSEAEDDADHLHLGDQMVV